MLKTLKTLIRPLILPGILLGSLGWTVGCDKGEPPAAPVDAKQAAIKDGQKWYATSCAVCHGFNGGGMPHQGQALRTSQFVAQMGDDELVKFIKEGRQPTDPKSAMKLLMPPKGNNPALTDANLAQIVAYLREMQKEAGTVAMPASGVSTPATSPSTHPSP